MNLRIVVSIIMALVAITNATHGHAGEDEIARVRTENQRLLDQWPGPNWFQSTDVAKIFLKDVLDSLPTDVGNAIRSRSPDIVVDPTNRRECIVPYTTALTVAIIDGPVRIIVCSRGLLYTAKVSSIIATYVTLGLGLTTDLGGEGLSKALARFSEDIANDHIQGGGPAVNCTSLEYVYAAVHRLPTRDCAVKPKGVSPFNPILLMRFQLDSMLAASEKFGVPKKELSNRDRNMTAQQAQEWIWATDEMINELALRIAGQYAVMHELGHIFYAHDKLGSLSFREEYLADAFAIDHSETALFPRGSKGVSIVYAKISFEMALFIKLVITPWRRDHPASLDQRMDESFQFMACYAVGVFSEVITKNSKLLNTFEDNPFISKEVKAMKDLCSNASFDTSERARLKLRQ